MINRWFRLAERYVEAVERQSSAWVDNMRAQKALAESHARRNEQLADIDERNTRAAEAMAADRTSLGAIGEFMAGTIERLAAIDTKLNCTATPLASNSPTPTNGENET